MPEENQIDDEDRNRENEPDVDRGFAWVVLIGCFFMYMLILGIMKSHGVLYTEMVEHFSSGSGNTAWVGSLAWLFMLLLGPIANLCSKRYGFRKVTVIGGVLVGTGYFLSGFVKKMELMYLTFSLCGIGYGLSYLPCATIVNFYFKRRRALANGIMVSSSGIGTLSFPFCTRIKKERQEKLEEHRNSCSGGELDFKFSLLKNPLFTMYVIAFMLATFAVVNNTVLIPAHIKALGYEKNYVALGVSITGGVEIIARIIFGWFADLKIVKTKYMFIVSMFIGGIFALITPFFSSFTYMAIYAVMVAAFPASFYALIPILTIEVIGMENLAAEFGIICLGMAFASVICQPICGWLEDYYGNWHPAFILTGSIFLLAGFAVTMEPAIVRLYNKSTSTEGKQNNGARELNVQSNEKRNLFHHGETNSAFVHDNCKTANSSPVLHKSRGSAKACENANVPKRFTSLEPLQNEKSNSANQIDTRAPTGPSFVHRQDGNSNKTYKHDFGSAHSTHL